MTFPEDLPWCVYYRMPTRGVILPSYPRTAVRVWGNGEHNAAVIRPRIPFGATAWSIEAIPWDAESWRPLHEIPAAWMPFVNRRRGSEMDPRPHDEVGIAESLYD